MTSPFFNLYTHQFARVAVATAQCRIADPAWNAAETIRLAKEAAQNGAVLVAFPELGITAYSCEDLFHQQPLLNAALAALQEVVTASRDLDVALVVGLPLQVEHQLFNCAVVIAKGIIAGIVPKSYLPNYSEFYEGRQFRAADATSVSSVTLCGQTVRFGTDLLFQLSDLPGFRFHVELCEDLWVPIPPSSYASLAGATVLVNLSASNALVGKAEYRSQLVAQQSARCLAAYLYASVGPGESSNDLAWDGHSMIVENGSLLAESSRYTGQSQLTYADIDLERLSHERLRISTFSDAVRRHADQVAEFEVIPVALNLPLVRDLPLQREVARYPYVPYDGLQRDARCQEVVNIQVQALTQRLRSTGFNKVVIGISGGLDSTHALLICAKAMDALGYPRTNILAYTMPGFATSTRTLEQARRLMAAVGVSASEVDIRPSCLQMLKDLGHPYAQGEAQYDVTFENVQAGERTNHLFRMANYQNGIVIGTGDLSELALGWCTYGVGDHMSHYNVNASVPKTLISYLVRWIAETGQMGDEGKSVLMAIVETEISPELVPGQQEGQPGQRTEDFIGPYALQDFNLYYTLRFGFNPAKIAFLALHAWQDATRGHWPTGEHVARQAYDLATIKKNLGIFVHRFFKTSQFKRTCVPNAPKVGSGGSLSPRGDWRAPSDGESTVWVAALNTIPDDQKGA
jgi:NAD+ synthase (glutamine-hydrolysing)